MRKGSKHNKETKRTEIRKNSKKLREGDISRKIKPNTTTFKKGHTPWNKGLKNIHLSQKTEFKVGRIPWNKGKKGLQVAWNKGKNWVHSGSFKKGHKINIGRKYSEERNVKIGKANLGKIRSEETKRKQSAIKQDIPLKDWRKFISFEPYDKNFNNKFKRVIRKRDNYICIKCDKHQEKEGRSLSVHHINYNKKLSILQNCCSLCLKCNNEVNGNRKHWIKFFQSLLSEKYEYKYSQEGEIIVEIKNEN